MPLVMLYRLQPTQLEVLESPLVFLRCVDCKVLSSFPVFPQLHMQNWRAFKQLAYDCGLHTHTHICTHAQHTHMHNTHTHTHTHTCTAVMVRIACEGGIRWISSLLESGHALLRNEGLVALNLFATLSDGRD